MVQGDPGAPGPVLGRVGTRSTEVVEGSSLTACRTAT